METVFDLLDMEDEKRDALLGVSQSQMADIARVCNRYPDIQLAYQASGARGSSPAHTLSISLAVITHPSCSDHISEL